ncbi:type II secretion system protein N [Limnohabitans sp. T6-20]|uniref:type II secretion system protein N n=1 Tax=Limnohabitans sp. T6-20 TaxID=1100725 RepID=UPI000D352F3F|nr:type II secretion system protein N [Limnohabitans sp. T6-20]PUE12164.1 general secretion pathway protein GspN [Limnohabitans sp. T6-20]
MITQPARLTWIYALWGALLGLGLAGIVWAPASWLAWGITQASQGQIQWQDARGTVWSGSAQLVLTGGTESRDAQALPSRLQWTLTPRWADLHIQWNANCCMTEPAKWHIKAGWSTWQIQASDHTSTWPAALLTGLGAPWNTLQPDGQLQLNTQGLQLQWAEGRMQLKGQAQLQLQNMSTRLSASQPIGSYLLQLRGSPEGTPTPSLQLSSQQGPLLLNGEGQWVGARLRFKGEASAQAGHEQALNNLLNILGRRQGARSLISLG